jgi:nucleotide-binding universal stress UspA family protein
VVSRSGARCSPDGGGAADWHRARMTHPIVAAVAEEDEARDAIALGVMASRLLDAPLVLAGIVVADAPGGDGVVPRWSSAADPSVLREYTARRLYRLADAAPDDVPCTIRIGTATGVLPGLEAAVEAEEAQLLVIGASHLGPLARAARGDIGIGAIRLVGCAVLIAPEGSDLELDREPRRIAVGWDATARADSALELAAHLAARAGADLEILHATGEHDAAEAAGRAVEDAVARTAEIVPCAGVVHAGPATGMLVEASGGCDLLVLGAGRPSGMKALWTTSVSAAVLHHARCPVLVVPQGARVPAAA